MALALQGELAVALAADEAGEEHVLILDFLLAREHHLVGVDHHDVVAGVHARSIGGLVPATDKIGGLDGEATEGNLGGIDQVPLGLHCLLLGEIRFHAKRGQELGFRESLSTEFSRDFRPGRKIEEVFAPQKPPVLFPAANVRLLGA